MARAQVLLAMDFNGGGAQQHTVNRICRLPVIGRMFELLRLILLTNISYAFSLFRCEAMGTGDFVDDESWDGDSHFSSMPQAGPTLFDMEIHAEFPADSEVPGTKTWR